MASKALSQAIACIDDILGSDNKELIALIDTLLNSQGISIERTCVLINNLNSNNIIDDECATALETVVKYTGFSESSSGVDRAGVAGAGFSLVADVASSSTISVQDGITEFSDIETMGVSLTESTDSLIAQGPYMQAVLNNLGLRNVRADDLINDTTTSLSKSRIGDLARQSRDGIATNFETLANMGSEMVGTTGDGQPDFNKGNKTCQGLGDVDPITRSAQIGLQVSKALCDVYGFVDNIEGVAVELNAALADPLRGLNLGVTLEKDACVVLIEDILENGTPDDICAMNSYYSERVTLLVEPFGNKIMSELAGVINGIAGEIKNAKLELDDAWLELTREISPCATRSDYSTSNLSTFIRSNNRFAGAYDSLHSTYNETLDRINQDTEISNENLLDGELPDILEPLKLSAGEISYLNDLFNGSMDLMDAYLDLIRDVQLAEEIKQFDFLDKSKVPYRNQEFDLNSNRKLEMDTQGRVTGINFNYADDPINGTPLIIKCSEF
jgi:hypothetical protein